MALGNAASNAQGRTTLDLQVVLDAVRTGFERISTSLIPPSLKQAISGALPGIRIHHANFALIAPGKEELEPFLVVGGDRDSMLPVESHVRGQLVPRDFSPARLHSHLVLPLSFEDEWFGIAVME